MPTRQPHPAPTRRALLGAAALPLLAACSTGSGSGGGAGNGAAGTGTDGVTSRTGSPAGTGGANGTGTATATTGPVPAGPTGTAALDPPGPDITHGPASSAAVALTFHGAGDPAILRRMLDVLRGHDARVTVLAIGQWLAQNPDAAKQVLGGDHELGNHTWSHPTLPRLGAAAARAEIEHAARELRTLTGTAGRWFRPSGTPRSTAVIRRAALAAGYGACLAYDVDPMDYADPGATTIESRFDTAVHPGAIVSLHLGHAGTVTAMPHLLGTLAARGLRAVTVSELLGAAR